MNKTSLKVPHELNNQLMIVSRLENLTKEELAVKLLEEGLKPYQENLKRLRFK